MPRAKHKLTGSGSLAHADRKENPSIYAKRAEAPPNVTADNAQDCIHIPVTLTLRPAYTGDSSGRVVMCPIDGDAWHLFWKWSRGPWAGWYVYWYLPRGMPLSAGLLELSDRYEQVLAGQRQPIKDTPRPQSH